MSAIKLVSALHALWGASLLLISDVPRPFGGLESYLTYMSPVFLGWVLLASAALPWILLKVFPRSSKYYAYATIVGVFPQQILLYWGVTWGFWYLFMVDFSPRVWLGLCYLIVCAVYHSQAATILYREARRGQ